MADYLLKGEATEPEPKGIIPLKGKAVQEVEEYQLIKNTQNEPMTVEVKIKEDDSRVFSVSNDRVTIPPN